MERGEYARKYELGGIRDNDYWLSRRVVNFLCAAKNVRLCKFRVVHLSGVNSRCALIHRMFQTLGIAFHWTDIRVYVLILQFWMRINYLDTFLFHREILLLWDGSRFIGFFFIQQQSLNFLWINRRLPLLWLSFSKGRKKLLSRKVTFICLISLDVTRLWKSKGERKKERTKGEMPKLMPLVSLYISRKEPQEPHKFDGNLFAKYSRGE